MQCPTRTRGTRLVLWCLCHMLLGCQDLSPAYFGTTRPRHGVDTAFINNGSEPEWIDPGKCTDEPGGTVVENLFAGLTTAHPKTLQPIPELAHSWEVSPDKQTYTFHLRPSFWSDGRPVTAADFAASWRRVLAPETASRYATMLHVFSNGEAYNEGALWVTSSSPSLDPNAVKAAFEALIPVEKVAPSTSPAGVAVFVGGADADHEKLTRKALTLGGSRLGNARIEVHRTPAEAVGIDAPDPLTVQVHLAQPVPYFLNLTAYHVFKPVPLHVLQRLQQAGLNTDLWTRPEYIVSNGPFTLGEWHFKHYFTYEKNPRYWDAAHVRLNHVKVFEIDNSNTALNLYRTGELDWLGSSTAVPAEFLSHLASFKDVHRNANLSVYFYWFNLREAPVDNVLLRRALSLAVDRESLVRYVARGGQIATADLVPDGLAGYRGLKRPLFDPVAARKLLNEAGYEDGSRVPPISLIYNTAEGHKQIAEAVQGMWKKYLGVSVLLDNQEWKVFLSNVELRNFQLARMGWVGDYPDANTFLHDLLTRHAGNNPSGYDDPIFDALIERANGQTNARTRLDLLREAEARALAVQPMIPLYIYSKTTLRKPYLRGYWDNYQDKHDLKYMWVDGRYSASIPATELPDPLPPEAP